MAKSTWIGLLPPDDPIYNGSFVVSSPKRKDAPPKGTKTYRGYQVVGKSELEKQGIDTSDELVISLDRRLK
jgi:hypothetical protein